MKIAYVSVAAPWSEWEQFIYPEVRALRELGHEVIMIPLRPGRTAGSSREALYWTKSAARVDAPGLVRRGAFWALRRLPWLFGILTTVFRESGSVIAAVKNLFVLPRALALGVLAGELGVEHLHAFWASTPALACLVASQVTDIPWSFSAHRGDIQPGSMLAAKLRRASFARVISKWARDVLGGLALAGDELMKVHLIRLGVELPPEAAVPKVGRTPTVACVARMETVKGHRYLLRALALLKRQQINVRCLLVGDGPLREGLGSEAKALGLGAAVIFMGRLPHERVLTMLADGQVDIAVLPSITTDAGEHEGVPVSLMEAMAAGVPVVGTDAGSTGELLESGAGLLVPERDPQALAVALASLATDPVLRAQQGLAGRQRVMTEFSSTATARRMASLLTGST